MTTVQQPELARDHPSGATSEPRRGRVVSFVRDAHLWLGLFTAVGVIVISVTGILLNHRETLGLGRQGTPAVEGSSGDIDAVLPIPELIRRGLEAGQDGLRKLTLRDVNRMLFRPDNGTVQLRLNDHRATEVILDTATGEVLDKAPRDDVVVEHLHSGEIVGQRGVILSDIVGVVLVLLLVSGVVVWIRRLRQRRGTLLVSGHGSRWVRLNWGFHLVGGLVVAAYLVVLSVTGVMLNHKRELGLMVEPVRILESEDVEKFKAVPLSEIVGWATAAARAKGVHDDVRFADYRPLSGYVKVRFKDDAQTEVVVDAYEDRVYSTATRDDQWLEALHSGLYWGPQWGILSDASGVFLILLSANGIYLWIAPAWRGRNRPRPHP